MLQTLMFPRLRTAIVVALTALTFSLSGSSSALADAPIGLSVPADAANSSTTIRIDGSSTMQTINQLLKQQYEQDNPEVKVTLDARGTNTAIADLLRGEIDLAALGRRLTEPEKAKGLVEIPLSQERIAIVVGKDNPFKGNLTVEQWAKILQGEIVNWAEVGGPDIPIRVIDRPLESDTRVALSRYGVFEPKEPVVGEHVIQLETDDTADMIRLLGNDGIGYAIASQVTDQNLVRLVKLVVMHEALPDDPLYPYEQVRGYAYKQRPNAPAAAFLNFAAEPSGQVAVATAKTEEARAIATALKPKPPAPPTLVPDTAYAPKGKGGVFYWFGWLVLPLILVGVLLQGIARWLKSRQTRGESTSVTPAGPVLPQAGSGSGVASMPQGAVVKPNPEVMQATLVEAVEVAATEPEVVTAEVEEPSSEPVVSPEGAPLVATMAELAPPVVSEATFATLYAEGMKLLNLGRYAEALPYFSQLIETHPTAADSWLAYGRTLLGLERAPEALESLDRVLALQPDSSLAWKVKGDALVKLGRSVEADPCYERANQLRAGVTVEPSALVEVAPPEEASGSPSSEVQEDVAPVGEADLAIASAAVSAAAPEEAVSVAAMGNTVPEIPADLTTDLLRQAIVDYLERQGKTPMEATEPEAYQAVATVIHHYLGQAPVVNLPANALAQLGSRIVGNLSAEYLPGTHLANVLLSLGLQDRVAAIAADLGWDLSRLIAVEPEPGLGRGDLGRLGICYLESLANAGVPAIAYGIRYAQGSFIQELHAGWQTEAPDTWLEGGNPWETERPERAVSLGFGGRTEAYLDEQQRLRVRWIAAEVVEAIPHDTLIPSYQTNAVNLLRLWRAVGDEALSRSVYPSAKDFGGKELRLRQQFFLTAATVQDVLRSHLENGGTVENLPERFALQLNDTDTLLAIVELMRLLMDEHALAWDTAWVITQRTFAYTNHSLLPESIDQYDCPVSLLHRLLPRHHEIILEINDRFLSGARAAHPGDDALAERLSLIDEAGDKFVRLVHLGCVGASRINGVSQLHTELLQRSLLPDFYHQFPEKFSNKTNGVSPRRFLLLSNPRLAELITRKIGDSWVTNLDELRRLGAFSDDANFRQEWRQVKQAAKQDLADWIDSQMGITVNPDSLFDLHAMDLHEYKRQHLNVLHILHLYQQIKAHPDISITPRTFVFAGKAAPDYDAAKLIIKLIHEVAAVVNGDTDVAGRLQVLFLPNFNLKLAQRLYPAADVSEHLSLSGTEACGTGSLIAGLNGAVLLATPDGVIPEVKAEIGAESLYQFGLAVNAVAELRKNGYNPRGIYAANASLRETIDRLNAGDYSLGEVSLFAPLTQTLLDSDPYMVLADYQSYIDCQSQVGQAFGDTEGWVRRSINTTARLGKFSSDRAVQEYCRDTWQIQPAVALQQIYAQS